MSEQPLSELIAAAAREMQGETDARNAMEKAVELGLRLVPGAEEAGISFVHRNGTVDTPAASGETARTIDELQYEHGEGPCLAAIRHQEVVYSADLAADRRWPDWGRHVIEETSVHSMMCFRLFTNQDVLGALNFYARQVDAFDEDDREHGLALAAHAAVAVSAALEVEHLKLGMDSRNVIGQAQGMLMERFGLDAQQAFNVLSRVSSTSNRKLRDVADQLARTRSLPGLSVKR